jgi:hypothetical protein
MLIENIRPFGNFTPGQTLEIPDGAIFDRAYWVHVVEVTHTVTTEQPEQVTETVDQPVTQTVTELEPVED